MVRVYMPIRCRIRPAVADDYAEPLAGMIRRGEIEPPSNEFVVENIPADETPVEPEER